MSDLTGQTLLNRYHVKTFVGRGGMAEVYKVWDARRTTHLAMKILREDMALDKVFLRRFKREAETLARLQHPNIVRFYGLEQDGQLAFMLMDFVEGRSLKHDIFDLSGSMPSQRVMEIMRPVCSALNYAHSEDLVHCDIKPGNILIDQTGRVLVSDFGIARMTDGATATMVGMGTPAYMAPEQVLGQAPLPQTDIYALGVVLYEMLTGGERPFTGERAKTTGSTSEKVRWEQLKLKAPSPRKHNPAISRDVEAVVLQCLSKEPEQRYSASLDLLNALERAMGGAEPAASPTAEATPDSGVEALLDTHGRARQDAGVAEEAQQITPAEILPVSPPRLEEPDPPPASTAEKAEPKPHMPSRKPRPKSGQPRTMPVSKLLGLCLLAAGVVVGLLALLGVFGDIGKIPRVLSVGRAVAPTPTRPSSTPTQEPTLTVGESARHLAEAGVNRNADWTPYTEEINGVLMVLVPAGCFQMGSEDGGSDERPVHEVCFEQPFWIDVTEVTNQQYGSSGAFPGEDRPRASINWFDAATYCESRGARLPTEGEWEYAARGIDALTYPWGDAFDANNLVFFDNANAATSNVGSKPGGISWVGALDMVGNVWEWVNSIYKPYPYDPHDGREERSDTQNARMLRGGSYFYRDPKFLHATYRKWFMPSSTYDLIIVSDTYNIDAFGFRCALSE